MWLGSSVVRVLARYARGPGFESCKSGVVSSILTGGSIFVAGVEMRNLTTPTVRLFNHILKKGILEINKTIRKYIQSGQDNDT